MMNLDARTVALARDARVRAHSGREPASGKSGAPADAFAVIFRRLKDQAAPASSAPGDSPTQAIPDTPREHSAPTAGSEARPPMRGAAPPNAPGSQSVGHSAPAQDLSPGGPVAQAGDLVADAAAGSTGETPQAPSDSVAPPAATMTVPLAREAALGSIIAATEQSAPESAISVLVDKSGAVARSGAEPIVFAVEEREAAAQGDTMTRFMPATPTQPQNHGVSASEAVAEPHAGAPRTALDTSARSFEALAARGGAVLDGAETAGGTVVDTLTEATGGGALSHLTSPPAVERATAQAPGQATGVERAQMIDQVVQGVRVAQSSESTEIIVQLKPDFLGKLSIRVLADEHGMRVEITAENQVVRQVLQDNLADLQQRLSEKGLALDQFNVFAEAGSHSGREPARSFDAPESGSMAAVGAAREVDLAETVSAAPSGVIDYFA